MSKFQEFRQNIEFVFSDDRKENAKLVSELKQLSPEELLKRGPATWRNISFESYREIVDVVAPSVRIAPDPQPRVKQSPWKILPEIRMPRSIKVVLATLSIAAMSISTVEWAAPMLAYLVAPIYLKRAEDASRWPQCRRLGPFVDGCLYVPQRTFNFREISQLTGIPAEGIINSNRHIQNYSASPNTTIIIWRGRGKLIRSNP
jgi:hypothetical protein